MVHLTKIPSEFSTADMRDSFMRQFVDQGSDVGLLNSEDTTDGRPVSKMHILPLIYNRKQKSCIGPPTKKSGVSGIIR